MTKRKPRNRDSTLPAYALAAMAMTAAGQEPRKHHLVPSFYLERWAVGGHIQLTDLKAGRNTYEQVPSKAVRDSDFYRIDSQSVGGRSPVEWESWLSSVEGRAALVFAQIDSEGLKSMTLGQHRDLCYFLAVQITRSRSHRLNGRATATQTVMGLYRFGGDQFLKQILRDAGLQATRELVDTMRQQMLEFYDDPWKFPMSRSNELHSSGQIADALLPIIGSRNMALYRTDRPLLTTDEPITEVYEDQSRHYLEGGLEGAPFLFFPFDPHHLLVLVREDLEVRLKPGTELTWRETLDANRVIAGNADRLVISEPGKMLAQKLYVPDHAGPTQRQEYKAPDGKSTLIRFWAPKRWHGDPLAPERAVPRLWGNPSAGGPRLSA